MKLTNKKISFENLKDTISKNSQEKSMKIIFENQLSTFCTKCIENSLSDNRTRQYQENEGISANGRIFSILSKLDFFIKASFLTNLT